MKEGEGAEEEMVRGGAGRGGGRLEELKANKAF
jgi:hypothetical protein